MVQDTVMFVMLCHWCARREWRLILLILFQSLTLPPQFQEHMPPQFQEHMPPLLLALPPQILLLQLHLLRLSIVLHMGGMISCIVQALY